MVAVAFIASSMPIARSHALGDEGNQTCRLLSSPFLLGRRCIVTDRFGKAISHTWMMTMQTGDSRRFGIADGLILIAGVAAGLGFLRALTPDIKPQMIWDAFVRPKGGWSLWYAFALITELGVSLGIPFLAAWTPTSLIVQLTKPRASWRRLCRQPGFVACLIATTVIALTVAASLTSVWLSIWVATSSSPDRFLRAYLLGGILAGSGVLWSWATMRLLGVCRPRPTWTDRLGRLTGAAWVALGAMSAVFIFLAIS
jgi:hypothetical protein